MVQSPWAGWLAGVGYGCSAEIRQMTIYQPPAVLPGQLAPSPAQRDGRQRHTLNRETSASFTCLRPNSQPPTALTASITMANRPVRDKRQGQTAAAFSAEQGAGDQQGGQGAPSQAAGSGSAVKNSRNLRAGTTKPRSERRRSAASFTSTSTWAAADYWGQLPRGEP